MLGERNNRLSCSSSRPALTTLAAHSGVLGLLRSAGKTAPQIAAAVHRGRTVHTSSAASSSGSLHCGLARLSPAALMSHLRRQAAPNCSGWTAGEGRGPAPNIPTPRLCLWGSVGPKPRLVLGFCFTRTTSQNVLSKTLGSDTWDMIPQRQARRTRADGICRCLALCADARWPSRGVHAGARGVAVISLLSHIARKKTSRSG